MIPPIEVRGTRQVFSSCSAGGGNDDEGDPGEEGRSGLGLRLPQDRSLPARAPLGEEALGRGLIMGERQEPFDPLLA